MYCREMGVAESKTCKISECLTMNSKKTAAWQYVTRELRTPYISHLVC